MQIDFHYCAIRVIAEKAGFSPEDSQIIAYASQHIDDAVDYEKMCIDGSLDILSHRFNENTFDPVCTAHKGLQFLKGLKEEVQYKIYIPFHFLPDFNSQDNLLVSQNCNLSKALVEQALLELCKSKDEKRVLSLVSLGIALHTYADSWTHQNFSGRHNSIENDICEIEIFRNNNWQKISLLNKLEYNFLPDIGHAEAGAFPDMSHLKWRFKKESDKQIYERDNMQIYLDAAENVMKLLKGLNYSIEWSAIVEKLQECFLFETEDNDEKFKKFQRIFPEIGFYYDEKQWRNEAIKLTERTKILKPGKNVHPSYVLESDKKWFFFHLAALQQRNYVLNRIENWKKNII